MQMVWDNSKENILEKFLVMLKGSNPVLSRTFLLNTAEFSCLLLAGLVDIPKCMYYMDFHGRTRAFSFCIELTSLLPYCLLCLLEARSQGRCERKKIIHIFPHITFTKIRVSGSALRPTCCSEAQAKSSVLKDLT